MTPRVNLAATAFVFSILGASPIAEADVVVLSNRTTQEVRFTIASEHSASTEYVLQAGELVTLPLFESSELSFMSGETSRQIELAPDSVHCFRPGPDGLQLNALSTAKPRSASGGAPVRRQPATGKAMDEQASTLSIPVKILVDEDEPALQRVWEERLRKRVLAASDILQRHCRVRLEVVDIGKWESDNQISNLRDLLRDFEQKVSPQPARLAIGFTSQRFSASDCAHLGGTRSALHTHILVREWFGRTEPERLEVLLHEVGHFLGAAHSAEADSVMRPVLGDGKAVSRKFRIGFDPFNTLAMSLIGQALGKQPIKSIQDLDRGTIERLADLYQELAQTMPSDPVAARYVKSLSQSTGSRDTSTGTATPSRGTIAGTATPRNEAARQVIAAVVSAAEQNQKRSVELTAGRDTRLTGDRLTEYYFRRAASRAAQLPREQSAPAFLLALAVTLDTSDMLRTSDWTRQIWATMESDEERKHRLAVIGLPTMQSRHDLLQHYVVSSALTVLSGPQIAEAAGILKEINDANGGSGFSFADLTADLAGISFATRLQAEPNLLGSLAKSFAVANYMPTVAGLREGLTRGDLDAAYGSPSDPRFLAERAAIVKLIQSLPSSKED